MPRPARESTIEDYLISQVKLKGGSVRKVAWIGRSKAPDRLVMIPGGKAFIRGEWWDTGGVSFYAELKNEGGHLKFPKNAHEEAQHREHERMRECGLRVEVIGSREQVDKILRNIYL